MVVLKVGLKVGLIKEKKVRSMLGICYDIKINIGLNRTLNDCNVMYTSLSLVKKKESVHDLFIHILIFVILVWYWNWFIIMQWINQNNFVAYI